MKSLSFILLLSFAVGQNLQLHYELDQNRRYLVSTLEMFQPDNWGSTFWFVDIQYNDTGTKSASLAYLELARYFRFPFGDKIQTTIQYNDGLALGYGLGQIWLGGLNSRVELPLLPLTVDILYRHQSGTTSHDVQLTGVWFQPFLHGKATFTGFFDLWTADRSESSGKDWIFLSEPQLWYGLSSQLAVGGEVHISYNFPLPNQSWDFYPTLAVKWEF
ncbi:MAG: DUF5020 family protein [Fidelibacterota bacterium]